MTEPASPPNETKVVRSATREGPTLVLELQGELDADVTGALYDEASREVDSWDGPVILDMRAVSFLDSSGIGCILRLRNDAAGTTRTISLRNTAPNVGRALTVTGLYDDLVVN